MLADSVGLALLVVLDTLTPAERLAFVLHDMFGVPFEEIAPIVDRTPGCDPPARQPRAATCARRDSCGDPDLRVSARSSTRSSPPPAKATSRRLLEVLDPDVVFRVDTRPDGDRRCAPVVDRSGGRRRAGPRAGSRFAPHARPGDRQRERRC